MIDNLDALLRDGNTTFPKLLQHWAQRFPDALAFREKDYGIWNRMTWQHYFETACRFALGLKSLGFDKGDRLADIAHHAGVHHVVRRHLHRRAVLGCDPPSADQVVDATLGEFLAGMDGDDARHRTRRRASGLLRSCHSYSRR